jgi:hypothetical protein
VDFFLNLFVLIAKLFMFLLLRWGALAIIAAAGSLQPPRNVGTLTSERCVSIRVLVQRLPGLIVLLSVRVFDGR